MNPITATRFRTTLQKVAFFFFAFPVAVFSQTNQVDAPAASKGIPAMDFDDVKVKGIHVSPLPPNTPEVNGARSSEMDGPDVPFQTSATDPIGGEGKKGEFVAAPIPFLNPAIGFGLALGAGYIYRPEFAGTNGPPWVTGGGGFYSENGSWGAAAAHRMNWNDDSWRLLVGAGYFSIKYDFFGIGTSSGELGQSIPIRQSGAVGAVELLRGISHQWFAGGRFLTSEIETSIEGSGANVPPQLASIPLSLTKRLAAAGLHVQRDARNNTFFPTKGSLFDLSVDFFDPIVGSDYTFQSYSIAYNHYLQFETNQVLAIRGYARTVGGNAPFFALSAFGSGSDLRGYTPGRYRDKTMAAAQAEFRWRIIGRFGVVGFAGLGSVAPDLTSFEKLLPSAGGGLRYVIAKKNNVSFRFDVARGRDETVLYFGVGEAF